MKKARIVILAFCLLLFLSVSLVGCDLRGGTAESSDGSAVPHVCQFTRENCELPAECAVCHETIPPEKHEPRGGSVREDKSCWNFNIYYTCQKCGQEYLYAHGDYFYPEHLWEEKTENGKTTYSCARCIRNCTIPSEVGSFRYEDVLREYPLGTPGVKNEGFHHENGWDGRKIGKVLDVIELASLEYWAYEPVSVLYDEIADIWCAELVLVRGDGEGTISFYITGDGRPCYSVAGE